MELTGMILIVASVISLAVSILVFIWNVIEYVTHESKKKFKWKVSTSAFVIYIIFITIGLVLINQ